MVSGEPVTQGIYCDRDADQDVVGGEILDLALGQAKLRGRIVKCGSISAYNGDENEAVESLKVRSPVKHEDLSPADTDRVPRTSAK